MSDFEELALKKLTKDYLVECIYNNINVISGRYGISNAEISKRIGWDPAGFNQKYNRNNDLRITTFIKIYVALSALIAERESEISLPKHEQTQYKFEDFITARDLEVGNLFIHIGDAAEGRCEFLSDIDCRRVYREMKPFVLMGRKSGRFAEREVEVYIKFLANSK